MRFFFNDAATTEIYTLSLRDALPISETVEEVTTMITQAGGTVNGAISLRPEYSDPSSASGLQSYVTGSGLPTGLQDRKSTRLNSSHANISYAVFCLKNDNQRSDLTLC